MKLRHFLPVFLLSRHTPLATFGKRHSNDEGMATSRELVDAIFKRASSGHMDYLGRNLAADPAKPRQEDALSYLCLKSALGWELLQTMEQLD